MKKIIITGCALFSLMACGNSTSKPESIELSKEELIAKKLQEAECKADFSMMLLENTMNIQALLIEEGFKKDLDAFRKLQNDTLITCDSIKSAWDHLQAKVI